MIYSDIGLVEKCRKLKQDTVHGSKYRAVLALDAGIIPVWDSQPLTRQEMMVGV